MIEWADTRPRLDVEPAAFHRLLGYPPGRVLDGRAAELEGDARTWQAEHGHPWLYAREVDRLAIDEASLCLDDVPFSAKRLRHNLREAGAHSVVLVAVGAGPEIEREAAARWQDGKPDEYYFLETFGSAIVEHLMTLASTRLCAWAEGEDLGVLPHDSPGYHGWNILEQPALVALIRRTRAHPLPGELDALASGALRPKKTQVAVFGLTRQRTRVRTLAGLVPCRACPAVACQYRRAPFLSCVPGIPS